MEANYKSRKKETIQTEVEYERDGKEDRERGWGGGFREMSIRKRNNGVRNGLGIIIGLVNV